MPQLDISEVTEIFVRINSQGKRLNEADFAMSKIAADEKYGGNTLRKAIDYFCHLAVEPGFYGQLANGDKEFMQTDYAAKLRWLKDDHEDIYDPDYNGVTDKSRYNQVANYAFLDTGVNISIGKKAPHEYFAAALAQCETGGIEVGTITVTEDFWANLKTNCIPNDIVQMSAEDYPTPVNTPSAGS